MRSLSLVALVVLVFALSTDALSGQGKDKDTKKEADPRFPEVFSKDLNQWILDLKDADPSIRQTACWGVCQFGLAGRKAVPALAGRLSTGAEPDCAVRAAAATAIATLGVEKSDRGVAVTALAEALGDQQRSVRLQAAYALGHMGPDAKAAIGKLASSLQDSVVWEIRQASARALGSVAHTTEKFADPTALTALMSAMADPSVTVRMEVVTSLFGIGHPPEKMLPAEKKVVEDRLTKERDHRVRIWLRVLLMMLDEKAHLTAANFGILTKALGDEDPRVRAQACHALGSFGTKAKEYVPVLLRAADESEQEVALAALSALANIGTPACIKVLTERLTRETEPLPVRIQIATSVHALGENGKPFVVELATLLTHREPELVAAAIRGLAAFGYWGRPGLPALKTLAADTKNAYLKQAAMDAIKHIDDAVKPAAKDK